MTTIASIVRTGANTRLVLRSGGRRAISRAARWVAEEVP